MPHRRPLTASSEINMPDRRPIGDQHIPTETDMPAVSNRNLNTIFHYTYF